MREAILKEKVIIVNRLAKKKNYIFLILNILTGGF